jgi:hypothetical protein
MAGQSLQPHPRQSRDRDCHSEEKKEFGHKQLQIEQRKGSREQWPALTTIRNIVRGGKYTAGPVPGIGSRTSAF